MPMARRPGTLFGIAVLLVLGGCDITIPIFHEDPTALSEDRSEEAKQLDDRIRGDILSAFADQEVVALHNVTVDVYEQKVLLTGTVAGADARQAAGLVARVSDDVETVINELQVIANSSLRDKAEDLSIENRLKASLRESSKINSFNLRWHSVNRIVYMFGRVRNQTEKDKALEIVRSLKEIQEIVDHILVGLPDEGQSWLRNLL